MKYTQYSVKNSFYEVTGKPGYTGYTNIQKIELEYQSGTFPKEIVEKYPFRKINSKT